MTTASTEAFLITISLVVLIFHAIQDLSRQVAALHRFLALKSDQQKIKLPGKTITLTPPDIFTGPVLKKDNKLPPNPPCTDCPRRLRLPGLIL